MTSKQAKGKNNLLQGKFDEIVDAVPVENPSAAPSKVAPSVKAWAIPLKSIYENEDVRLDATHYDREVTAILTELRRSKFPLKPLTDFASVRLPGQFVRIWADSSEYGIPYVNASDLMSIAALGIGEEKRYLSKKSEVDIDELIIHEGWLALSCSGTIGRVFYIPKRLDGWVATHDLIRIVPHEKNTAGFLHAYLFSSFAQTQILGHTYGGQIDHVTEIQVGSILVPELPDDLLKEIHKKTMTALLAREQAIQSIEQAAVDLQKTLKK